MTMTTAYPIKEIFPKTWEIDEFDCDSIFVLEGEHTSLVIDTGTGIGDLKAAIAKLTKKPYILVITHQHPDHVGGIGGFKEAYLNEQDWDLFPYPPSVENRKQYAGFITKRSGLKYPYDPETDIVDLGVPAKRLPLTDRQTFDLGGRVVTAYACPGHTPGSFVLIDSLSKILFAGDAINGNLLYGAMPGSDPKGFVSVETALRALERLEKMQGDKFTRIYNQHHDYRPFGEPFAEDMFPSVLKACRALVSGNYKAETIPGMFPGTPDRTVVKEGPAMITFKAEGIHDRK